MQDETEAAPLKRKTKLWIQPDESTIHDQGFAPYHGPRVCHSPSGRWRAEHLVDGEGTCILCGAVQEENDEIPRGRRRVSGQSVDYVNLALRMEGRDVDGRRLFSPSRAVCDRPDAEPGPCEAEEEE